MSWSRVPVVTVAARLLLMAMAVVALAQDQEERLGERSAPAGR